MIQGYPRWPSLRPGEALTLHVSTDAPWFRVDVYRQGARMIPMGRLGPPRLPGTHLPSGPPDQDWGWRGYDLPVPLDWPSGAYVALLVEIDADGREAAPDPTIADGPDARALFVLRSPMPGLLTPVLYKVSWATFHAYNGTGGGSLYAEGLWSSFDDPPGFKVTWRRPGGGTGGLVMLGDSPDAHQPEVRRNNFAKWDVPLIAWLEAEGHRVEYCTDWDLHRDPEVLRPYRLLLSVGHDEYWSEAMRERMAAFVAGGGNLAFLSGNIAGYRIHFTDGDTAMTCAKLPPGPGDGARTWAVDRWPAGRPENALTGVSLDHGGGWWSGWREPLGYTVQHAGHWAFAGTGLHDGDLLGADPAYPLVGYEADGAPYAMRDGLAVPTGDDQTPPTFFILGLAEMSPGWMTAAKHPAATMGIYATPGGGTVFQAATTDWPILVPRDRQVAQVTRNVLARLSAPGVRVVGPLPPRGGRMLAVEGEASTFHADVAPRTDLDALEFRWEVVGADGQGEGPLVRVAMPSPPAPVSVSVTVRQAGAVVGFGTRTLLPLSREEALKRETLVLLREMVVPSAPQKPLVAQTADPADGLGLLYGVRLPWIGERAARLREVTDRLIREGPGAPTDPRKEGGS
jgi:hypothetical protein